MSGSTSFDTVAGPAGDPPPQSLSPLHRRVRTIVAGRTYRELGEITRTHPETVRRYLHGHAPSIEFLTRLASSLRVNPAWLLTGEGAMHASDVRSHALRDANPTELLTAVASTLERLAERIGRMETLLLTLESRLREHAAAAAERRALALDIAGYAPTSGPSAASGASLQEAVARGAGASGAMAGVAADLSGGGTDANTQTDGSATQSNNQAPPAAGSPHHPAPEARGAAHADGGGGRGVGEWIARGLSRGPRADAGGHPPPDGG